eukprot:jgi/Psemu1/249836/estExt_Genewise1Plus.C_80146
MLNRSLSGDGTGSSATTTTSTSTSTTSTIENVYDNLTYIFERDYGSTLRSVQYRNIRTGKTNFIGSFPVRPVITRNGSRGASTAGGNNSNSSNSNSNNNLNSSSSSNHSRPLDTASTPWGGTASTAVVPVSDPSEWHTGPFCHVYIAACDNTDHYRNKIRPALRAFVSQLESAPSNTAGNQQGGHSADYLIVYIPSGGMSASDGRGGMVHSSSSSSSSKNNNNHQRVGFFGKARQRFGGVAGLDGNNNNDDAVSKDSADSGDDAFVMAAGDSTEGDEDESVPVNVLTALQHLSKNERSLYKKIVTDFPNGKVAVISPISLDRSLSPSSSSSSMSYGGEEGLAIRVQEWHIFNRMLGTVIVNGFQDRIRRYKNELKRLDNQRATVATAARNYESGGVMGGSSSSSNSSSNNNIAQKPNPYAFNLSHFFLVKESLASSYEQMQLPAEALLQYDEFRLYMPDLTDKEERRVRDARRNSKALLEDGSSSSSSSSPRKLTELADAGDFVGFRKKIRPEYDLTAILDIMRRYLFARELSLLFRMKEPVELLSRCQAFIKVMYSILLRGISDLSDKEQTERKTKAASWVVQFSWDIYSNDRRNSQLDNNSNSSRHDKKEWDELVAAKLIEILEVSRLFLIQLGEDHANANNESESFSIREKKLPADLGKPWPPWVPCEAKTTSTSTSDRGNNNSSTNLQGQRPYERQFMMKSMDELNSADKIGETYLKLCTAIIDMCHLAKHNRFAARIQAEVGEYHVRKGDFRSAAASFQKIVKVYRIDHWDRAFFWRIFRLAYCQRTTVEPTAYLKTLCSCFSPRSAAVAPKKAFMALFDDLQRVIEHPSIGNARYSRLSFIETSLSISTPSTASKVGKLLDQKQLEKRFCSIGEEVKISISIKSHLPGSIELSSVKLFAVTVGDFSRILTSGDAVQEEDAAKVLSIDATVQLNPGENKYTFEWSPSSAGQYILSTVEILWKQGYFYYDSMDLQEPMLSIEVLPSKPTHSISVEPTALIPGQDQEVQICFEAGSDYVTSGNLILSGTDGIRLIPPGKDPSSSKWTREWVTSLEPCQPGEKLVLTTLVRCGLSETQSNDSNSTRPDLFVNSDGGLVAKLQTTYLHSKTEGDGESNPASMQTTLKSFTPILKKTALSVESIETHWLDDDASERFLLSIALSSNSPYHFSIEEWDVRLASPITIASSVGCDLNENLLKRSISDGDQLSFAFECNIEKSREEEKGDSQTSNLHLKLRTDTGRAFPLDLPLDLDGLYSSLPSLLNGLKSSKNVLVTLKLEEGHGPVGEPVEMTFVIANNNNNTIEDGVRFLYSIDCGQSNWLVGGKVNGMIETSNAKELSFVGIPIVPGMLNSFPTLTLKGLEPSGNSASVSVDCYCPDPFRSIAVTEVSGVASPSVKE